MCHQNGLQLQNLFSQLADLSIQGIVFAAEDLNLLLKVLQPLLLPLSTFQSGDSGDAISIMFDPIKS